MALVSCPECQQEVSSLALACPRCAYPYPGRQGSSNQKLQTCVECGAVISKKAQSCPHCGISFTHAPKDTKNKIHDEATMDETWLCSHCGTPYTRKVRKPSVPDSKVQPQPANVPKPQTSQAPPADVSKPQTSQALLADVPKPQTPKAPTTDTKNPPAADERGLSFLPKLEPSTPLQTGRHHSPLWFPSTPPQDLAKTHVAKKKKLAIMIGVLLVFLVVLSMAAWGLLQPNGTNPFEVLTLPAWSMNNFLPGVPEGKLQTYLI